jgi:hypothetical protein
MRPGLMQMSVYLVSVLFKAITNIVCLCVSLFVCVCVGMLISHGLQRSDNISSIRAVQTIQMELAEIMKGTYAHTVVGVCGSIRGSVVGGCVRACVYVYCCVQ